MGSAALLALAVAAAAPSLQAYSGLLDTPSAWVLPPGNLALLFTNEEDPRFRRPDPITGEPWPTRTFTLVAGFLPYTEGHARITDVSPFGGAEGKLRDLSFGGKLQLPLDLLWHDLPFAVAVGTADEGGAASNFRSRYAVASGRLWRLEGSVGWGSGPDRLKGVFGGLQLRAAEWASVIGEYDAKGWNAGVRLSVPGQLAGVPFAVGLVAKTTLDRDFGKPAWAVNLSVPLGLGKEEASSSPSPSRGRDREGVATGGVLGAPPQPSPRGGDGEAPGALERTLERLGFQSVQVGFQQTTLLVHYENNLYNHSEADGVGVVLAAIRAAHLATFTRYAITLHRNGLAQAELSGPMERGRPDPARMQFAWRPQEDPAPVSWAFREPRNSSALKLQLTLAPGLVDYIATEVGLFHYVLSLRPEATVNLWAGASANARWDLPILWTDAFDEGGPLRPQRGTPRLDAALLQQVFPLAPGLTALLAGGIYQASGNGALAELAFAPGQGAQALGLQGAWMREGTGREHQSLTGSYRWHFAPLDLLARVQAGRFYQGDEGALVELSRFFGDTSIGVYYAHTDHQVLGFKLTLPLTPRRDMRPGLAQLRGSRRWAQQVTSRVGEARNVVSFGGATPPVSPWNLEGTWLDAGRLDADGLKSSLPSETWADEQVGLPFLVGGS